MATTKAPQAEPISSPNIVPLIDVLLVLIIMMILTIPAMTHSVKVDLPGPNPVQAPPGMKHQLDVSAAGTLSLDGVAIDERTLADRLGPIAADDKAELTLNAHPSAPYRRSRPRHDQARRGDAAGLCRARTVRHRVLREPRRRRGRSQPPTPFHPRSPVLRTLLCLFLLAGCSAPVVRNSAQVDLNNAADRALGNVEAKVDAPVPVPVPVATHATAVAYTRYRCMDGSRIALRFDHVAQTLALSRDGKAVATLSSRKPPSGIWYSNDAWELRGEGEMATLSAPGLPPVACKAIA